MAFNIADRVFETSTTQGTGTLNLGGAVTGAQSFVAGVGDGNETYYFITDGTDWESGIGTVTAGAPDTLSRDTILESSNTDAAVNWGSGTRNVFIDVPAEGRITRKTDNTFEGDNTFQGDIRFTDEGELTIATGAITVTAVNHTVDTEADAASDDLDTINGGVDGQILIIRPENTARTIVLKDGTGNIECPQGADISLDTTEKSVLLKYDGQLAKWIVIASPSVELLDEDDFASNSDTKGATQQSIKAYVDANSATIGAWTTYTPSFTGFGTVSGVGAKYRRVGNDVEVMVKFTTGTCTAVIPEISLPSGLTIDGSIIGTRDLVGHGARAQTAAVFDTVLATGSDTTVETAFAGAGGGGLTPQNASVSYTNSSALAFKFSVPVTGW